MYNAWNEPQETPILNLWTELGILAASKQQILLRINQVLCEYFCKRNAYQEINQTKVNMEPYVCLAKVVV